jgi:polyisoprenoid-binding protein YceI
MSNITTWSVDPTHTHIEFAVRHLMISTVKGRFAEFSGVVQLDPADLTTASLDVTIDVASLDTRVADRDNHLRSADFFDAATHPTITYVSRKVVPQGDEYRVIGDLTIRGVTREVPLAVSLEGQAKDPWGNQRMAFAATTKINRADFGLTWNAALEAGGVVVGEEVKISIDVELIAAAAQAAA